MYYYNGDIYEGSLKDGKRHGSGMYIQKTHDKTTDTYIEKFSFTGWFEHDKLGGKSVVGVHGAGEMIFANGNVYHGCVDAQFKPVGKGTMTDSNGTKVRWVDGALVPSEYDPEEECPITQEPFGVGPVSQTPCKHNFLTSEKFLDWIKGQSTCPVCRATVRARDLVPATSTDP